MKKHTNEERASPLGIPSLAITIFFLFVIGVGFVGYYFFRSERKALIRHEENNLSAIADLKVKEILDWRKERMGNASVIANNPLIIHHIEEYWRSPGSSEIRNNPLLFQGPS